MKNNIAPKRYLLLSDFSAVKPRSVIYIMSRDQRTESNPALFEAQRIALENKLPLIVFFNIHPGNKRRLLNQYEFMIQGLVDVSKSLAEKNISFLIRVGNKTENLRKVILEYNPHTIVFDFMPFKATKNLYYEFAASSKCGVIVVDAHNIVPTWIASQKQEFSAATFRRKIHKLWRSYVDHKYEIIKHPYKISVESEELGRVLEKIDAFYLENYKIVLPGREKAISTIYDFINTRIELYDELRNNPTVDYQSGLSPYLHFGTISSQEVIEVMKKELMLTDDILSWPKGAYTFFEEIVVRKELSDNFCFYNDNYNNYEGIPAWAKRTFKDHSSDKREVLYSYEKLDNSQTHDPAWNAAQNQMKLTGKMHGYMRMYWAKKILEWTDTPQKAIEYAVNLNDTYSLDGYDPNGYAGILWSVGGLHDRPWFNKPVYGMVRYMNYNGLKNKFDIQKYIKEWT
jgi:deoxyribodipyrimidine photo-lyase